MTSLCVKVDPYRKRSDSLLLNVDCIVVAKYLKQYHHAYTTNGVTIVVIAVDV